jgi:hypothetical protein
MGGTVKYVLDEAIRCRAAPKVWSSLVEPTVTRPDDSCDGFADPREPA